MNIQSSIFDNAEACSVLKNAIYLRHPSNELNSPLHPPSTQLKTIGAISPWEVFWDKAKEAQIVDDNGCIREEIIRNYPMGELSSEEIQAVIKILKEPIHGKNDITFTLLDYFSYLIEEAPKHFQITLTSINLIGGILPSALKSYYIRNLNELYKKQCIALGIEDIQDLISGAVAADFDRIPPDTDILTTIDKGDLGLMINLGTRFFAKMLKTKQNINQKDKLIRDTFYNAKTVLPNFSLVSFGATDCNFVHNSNINQNLFLHHALRLNILPLIKALNQKNCKISNKNELNLSKLIPTHEYCGGWEAMLARAGKKLVCKNVPNDRAWVAYISNKTIGYSFWDPKLERKLFEIMIATKTKTEMFTLLKKKWQDHHFKEPLALIPLVFNAVISLLENHYEDPRSLWIEATCWYEAEIIDLEKQQKPTSNAEKSPFLIALKETIEDNTVPIEAFRDILHVYECLMHSSPQLYESTPEPKALLSNSEAIWHEVTISQKIDLKNYAISIPLNLLEAIQTLLKLTFDQFQSLSKLTSYLSPRGPFKRGLIPTDLITDNLADEILKCFDHPHNNLNSLGYDLLLLYALSTPKPWILKTLIKHLPKAFIFIAKEHYLRLLINLENALKGFPETIEIHKITTPLISFCVMQRTNSDEPLLEFCIALASTNDPELVHEAVKLHASIENATLQHRIRFLKILLRSQSAEAAKLLLKLQKQKLLTDVEEIKIFTAIAEEIRQKAKNSSSHLQPLSISDYSNVLLQADKAHARQMCLLMASALLDQGLPEEAQKWVLQILKLAAKIDDNEALFFLSQNSNFPLLSIDLPPNPTAAIDTLFKLHDDELKIFFELTPLSRRIVPSNLPHVERKFTKAALINCAKECLKHAHPYIKCIGFELLMVCTGSFTLPAKNSDALPEIDPMLLTVLISYLPVIISSNPGKCEMIFQGMRTLFFRSSFAKHTEQYLTALNDKLQIRLQECTHNSLSLFKDIYQTNCIALASTQDETLCKISKDLFTLKYIKRLAPSLKEIDQIEIALTSISQFLMIHVLLALESLKMLEIENKSFKSSVNKFQHGTDKRRICIQLINALIDQNFIQTAKEQLLKSLEEKTFVHSDTKIVDLWLNLLNKALKDTNTGVKETVELWKTMQKYGKLQKTHSNQYIEFIIDLLQPLLSLQGGPYDDFICELQRVIKNLAPTVVQQSRLSLLLLNDLKTNLHLNSKRLKLCSQVLVNTELSWFESTKIDYLSTALLWIKASQNEIELRKEASYLLTNVLKYLSNSSCTDDNIAELYAPVSNLLKWSLHDRKLLTKDLKILIIQFHLRIAFSLKKSFQVDDLFEYLYILKCHNLLDNTSTNFFDLSLGLATEILSNDSKNTSKLKTLHKLIKGCFQNDISLLQIVPDKKGLPAKLATSFLNLRLYSLAKEWIEVALKMQKCDHLTDSNLTELFISWCEDFIAIDQLHYSLTLLNAISSLPNLPKEGIQAELFFKISKGLLKENPYVSAQIVLDNWPTLNREIEKIELQAHLKDVIDFVLTSEAPDKVKLTSSLIALHYPLDEYFILEVLTLLSEAIKLPRNLSSEEEIQTTEFYEIVASTFFSTELETINDAKEHQKNVDLRFNLLTLLTESSEYVHVLSGITLLNKFLEHAFKNEINPLEDIEDWVTLGHAILSKWFTKTLNETVPKFSKTIFTLIENQSKLILSLPTNQTLDFKKVVELSKLRNCIYSPQEIIESSIEHYTKIVHNYCEDLKWLGVSQMYILDNITRHYLDFGNSTWYLEIHKKLFSFFEEISLECLYSYSKIVSKIYLLQNLKDSKLRAAIMYLAAVSLIILTEQKNLNVHKNVEEIVQMVDDFLNYRPFLKEEWTLKLMQSSQSAHRSEINNLIESLFNSVEGPLLLSREFFHKCFVRIVENLEKVGCDKNFPKIWQTFNLIIHHKINPNETENDGDESHSLKNKLENTNDCIFVKDHLHDNMLQAIIALTIYNQFNAIKNVIVTLLSYNDPFSSAKALTIFIKIPRKYWHVNFQNLNELFSTLVNDNNLYPDQITSLVEETLSLSKYHQSHPNSTELPQTFCNTLLNKLFSTPIMEDTIAQCHNSTNYHSAIMFLPKCIERDLIDKNDLGFPSTFLFHLKTLLSSKITDVNRSAISNFIICSLHLPVSIYNDNWKTKNRPAIWAAIDGNINEIFVNDDEMLEENLNVFFEINSCGYFSTRSHQLLQMWQFFSHQYPKTVKATFGQLILKLVNCLLTISSKFSIRRETESAARKKMQVFIYNMISSNIDYFFLNDENEFEKNLNNLKSLFEEGYYVTRDNQLINHLEILGKHCLNLHEKQGHAAFSPSSLEALLTLLKKAPQQFQDNNTFLIKEVLCISISHPKGRFNKL
ncbi:MAG: hypothetical protein H0W50_04795 [Parachlamydiaceae bacterium]|nr:hypothetical protein [Parachlamydiaceae bacterium]